MCTYILYLFMESVHTMQFPDTTSVEVVMTNDTWVLIFILQKEKNHYQYNYNTYPNA